MSPIARRNLLPLALVVLGLAGCGQPVREDRSITWSSDGSRSSFQHGREGVFIVEGEGSAPKKIFQPGPDVVATSAPLWSPTDKRLLFTTARRAEKPAEKPPPREQDPAGNLYTEQPTVYTCWLRGEGADAQPAALFEAPCDHPGYVAANLAVRWHHSGKRVLYVKQTAPGRHGLFEYDLGTKTSHLLFPHEAGALVFDWAPDGAHLACVVGSRQSAGPHDGIWVARPGTEQWWHVPGSEARPAPELPALLEALRTALPVWTADSRRFAFRLAGPPPAGQTAPVHTLHVATVAGRKVETVAEDPQPFHDLYWRPDGHILGAVCGEGLGRLVFVRPGGKAAPAGPEGVAAFAGWDARGEQLAYVAAEPIPGAAGSWAFLFVPEPAARQAAFVRKEGGAARRLFGGMQVTFPRWSPGESRLSLWATFVPPYRSWPSLLLELGASADDPLQGLRLRSGDPALLLDPATGKLSWKAIDTREKTQVGHYYLLRRDYAEAWRWYEQAGEEKPSAPGADAGFFHAYCLDKLGRHGEAEDRRRRFEQAFLDSYRAARKAPRPQPAGQTAFGAADYEPTDDQLRHWRDLYVAEVFLSLDAVEDGETYFRQGLKAARDDAERLSKALVLTQFLLLRHKNSEYVDLAAETVLPLLLRSWKPRTPAGGPPAALAANNALLAYGDSLALLPLAAPEFLAGLPDKQVRGVLARGKEARALAEDDVKRLVVDLLLQGAHQRLGQTAETAEAARRLAANAVRGELLGDKGVAGLIENLRVAPAMLEALRHLVAVGR